VTVTAPPRPPSVPEPPPEWKAHEASQDQALIEEARRRARRRRRAYVALAAVAAAGLAACVFAFGHGASSATGRALSGGPRPVALPGSGNGPSRLAIARWVPGVCFGSISTVRGDGSGLRELASDSRNTCGVGWPAVSPDGRTIAFATGAAGDIYLIGSDGHDRRRLVTGSYPSWSPDGRLIVYAAAVPVPLAEGKVYGGYALFVVGADGQHVRRLSRHGIAPAWSPDGKMIAAWGCQAAPQGLCLLDAGGIYQRVLSRHGGTPSWSPDGKKIAYLSGLQYGVGIHVINADGSKPRLLPTPVFYKNWDCKPAWSPDGKWIAYTSGRMYGDISLTSLDGLHTKQLPTTAAHNGCGISWQPTPTTGR